MRGGTSRLATQLHDFFICALQSSLQLFDLCLHFVSLLFDRLELFLLDFAGFLGGGAVAEHSLDAALFLLFGSLGSFTADTLLAEGVMETE